MVVHVFWRGDEEVEIRRANVGDEEGEGGRAWSGGEEETGSKGALRCPDAGNAEDDVFDAGRDDEGI